MNCGSIEIDIGLGKLKLSGYCIITDKTV